MLLSTRPAAGYQQALVCELLLGVVIALSAAAVFVGVQVGAAHVAQRHGCPTLAIQPQHYWIVDTTHGYADLAIDLAVE